LTDFNVVVRGGFEGSESWDDVAWARVEGDALRIAGSNDRELVVSADRVARIRFAHFPGTSTTRASWETKIWAQAGGEPLLILAPPDRANRYGPVMREFAQRVVARHGIDRVRRGPGLATAIVNFALSGCSVMALAGLLLVVAFYDGRWWLWLIAAAATLGAGLLAAALLRSGWPRRIRSLDELGRELPSGKG
jgi:hypothetical protein